MGRAVSLYQSKVRLASPDRYLLVIGWIILTPWSTALLRS